MTGKLPTDSFEYYFSLGHDRSYQAVADHFGVSKRSVTTKAAAEDWQQRIVDLESQARARSDERLVETIEGMNTRHLKTLRAVQAKAIQALKSHDVGSAMDAVRALEMAIRQERLIRGEPSERTATSLEEIIRSQASRWLDNNDEETEAGTDTEDEPVDPDPDDDQTPEQAPVLR